MSVDMNEELTQLDLYPFRAVNQVGSPFIQHPPSEYPVVSTNRYRYISAKYHNFRFRSVPNFSIEKSKPVSVSRDIEIG
jgi:hypothetical protein